MSRMILSRALSLIPLLLLAGPVLAAQTPVPAPPPVSAASYIVIANSTGKVIAAKNPDKRHPPASLTKMMVLYITFGELKSGSIHLSDPVTISEKAWRTGGSRMFIRVGHKVPVRKLIEGIIVDSGNDATVALSQYVAGSTSGMVSLMNHNARQLGMKNTHYADVDGLPHPDHYSTARDLATLARAIIDDYPKYYKEFFAQKELSWNGIKQYNRNKLLWRSDNVDGLKTGHTEAAGYCLVSSAHRDGMRLIAAVLDSRGEEGRINDSQALLNYGFRFYETHQLYAAGKPLTKARVWKGRQQQVGVGLRKPLYVTIPRGRYKDLKAMTSVKPDLTAPISPDSQVGTVKVSLAGKVLAQRPLYPLQAVPEGGLLRRMFDSVRLMFQ